MKANTNSIEESLDKFRSYYNHKKGDHSKCFVSDDNMVPCQNTNWNEKNSSKIIINEIDLAILEGFLYSPQVLNAMIKSWKGGSTSFNETLRF